MLPAGSTNVTPTAPPSGGEAPAPAIGRRGGRLLVLDGWRAISVLLVLGTHMLPLGPKSLRGNETAGMMGMSLFFTLSGFLIAEQLHNRRNVVAFLVRRMFRIAPLAWAYAVIAALAFGLRPYGWLAHFAFFLNYDYSATTPVTVHFWSLCVEVHFYLAIALLMAVTRFRGFTLLPVAWLVMTVVRAVLRPEGGLQTHLRVDEILAGSCLALVHLGYFGARPRAIVSRLPFLGLVVLLVLASHPVTGRFNALRGLLASSLVGHTLFHADSRRYAWLRNRVLRYIAETSYAIYVIHPFTMTGWLGSGDKLTKYAKRILSFSLTFGLAHLSTFYYERRLQNVGKRIAARVEASAAPTRFEQAGGLHP
jgi:peptidoglycan/LPS O-acetylase OafA/YrhL